MSRSTKFLGLKDGERYGYSYQHPTEEGWRRVTAQFWRVEGRTFKRIVASGSDCDGPWGSETFFELIDGRFKMVREQDTLCPLARHIARQRLVAVGAREREDEAYVGDYAEAEESGR